VGGRCHGACVSREGRTAVLAMNLCVTVHSWYGRVWHTGRTCPSAPAIGFSTHSDTRAIVKVMFTTRLQSVQKFKFHPSRGTHFIAVTIQQDCSHHQPNPKQHTRGTRGPKKQPWQQQSRPTHQLRLSLHPVHGGLQRARKKRAASRFVRPSRCECTARCAIIIAIQLLRLRNGARTTRARVHHDEYCNGSRKL
jgi:hypothetical protein